MSSERSVLGVGEDGLVPLPEGGSPAGWHSIEAMGYCPKAYQFEHVRGVVQSGQDKTPLNVGTMCHIGRAQFLADGGGSRWEERMREWASNPANGVSEQNLTTAIDAFTRYLAWTPQDRDIVAVEYTVKKELRPGVIRTARLDAVERIDGRVVINELKTSKAAPGFVMEQYRLSGQLMLQALLFPEDELGKLDGIRLEVIPVGGRFQPSAYFIPLYPHQFTWFRKTLVDMVADAEGIGWNSEPRRNCSLRTCQFCRYKDLCQQGDFAKGQYQLLDGTPLEDWRPSPGKEVEPWL